MAFIASPWLRQGTAEVQSSEGGISISLTRR